jgi:hypothetical protein
LLVFADEPFNATQFFGTKAKLTSQRYRAEPELRRLILAIHVDVRWFIRYVMVDEVNPIRTGSENGWHVSGLSHTLNQFIKAV